MNTKSSGVPSGGHDVHMTDDLDAAVRLRAFDFLIEQRRRFGDDVVSFQEPQHWDEEAFCNSTQALLPTSSPTPPATGSRKS